eukprot:4915210-Lingulodinium_polyedra.AAC.1
MGAIQPWESPAPSEERAMLCGGTSATSGARERHSRQLRQPANHRASTANGWGRTRPSPESAARSQLQERWVRAQQPDGRC